MKINTSRNSVAAAVLFSVLSGISTVGHSNLQDVNIKSQRVSYADLDLRQGDGQTALYQRLKSAAQGVCGDADTREPLEQVRQQRKCYQEAMDEAVQQVGSRELQVLHEG
jgi:UrcA family protein